MSAIIKAVFPVAGLGTRFLPATKANPKEMLPVVDKPLIQYAVEEAIEAGVSEMVFINGRNKRSIPDHFDKAYELEAELEKAGKKHLLELARSMVPQNQACIYIRQPEPLGLGHAVLCSRPVVGNNPFAVLLADDLIDASTQGAEGVVSQLVKAYEQSGCSILAVRKVPRKDTSMYGIVDVEEGAGALGLMRVKSIVEKPKPDDAPSCWAVVGRYLLTPRIFTKLDEVEQGSGGEIQLTDGIAALLAEETVLALPFKGKRYDCGSKIGYLEATLAYASKHPELGDEFRVLVKEFAASL